MAKPFAYLLLAALIGYAALANGQAPEATIEADFYSVNDVENSFLSHYVSVTPGQTLAPVSVVLTNPGAEAWPAGLEATLVSPDDGSWVLSGNDGTLVAEEEGEIEEGSSVTLSGWINSTADIGVHVLTFELSTGEDSTEVFELEVEVTCSDHVFCNGRELWINGTCVSENVNPCRIDYDPQDCASFKCLEKTQRCEYTLEGDDCMPCMGCVPDCNDKECGADGCGGKCGTCESGLACVEGQCTELAIPGSCNDPFPFFAEGVEIEGRHIIRNDTTIGIHQVTPDCNSGSTARELVYHFTIPEDGPTYGVMMQYYGIGELDTVLELRSGSCEGPSVSCNDDAYPPGDYGSRIQLMLEPGEYYLILDHYNEENYGPFELFADFVVDCVPRCNSLYCGDNSCGGDCGPCDSSQVCSESNVCVEKDCEPDCDGRACGDDGCGGSCGDCQNEGELCVFKTGKCEVFEACNHMVPTCEGGCDDNSFCGTDCKCHAIDEPLPDLVVDSGKLLEQIHIEKQTFAESDCAVAEGCILAAGTRRLLRFTVETANHGKGTLVLGDPAEQPLFFSWSPCHGHFHFEGYAHYLLLEDEAPYRNVKERGRKQGYCVYDGYRRLSNPSLPCSTNMSCASQGIQPGWVDNYGWSLDCQWLDITDVEPGDYLIFVEVNFQRKIAETNYDNNKAYVKVTIPEDTDDDSSDDGEDGSPSTMCLPLTGTLLL